MVFYEIIGKLNKSAETVGAAEGEAGGGDRQSGLFDKNGRVPHDRVSTIQIAVDNVAEQTVPHKVRLDVSELKSDRFRLIAVAAFAALKKVPLKKAAGQLLCELSLSGEITQIEEITEPAYCDKLKAADRNDYCAAAYRVRDEFELDSYSHGFTYLSRKIEPIDYGKVKTKTVPLEKVTAYAESLVCENLVAEVGRISARQKYGTPVHYLIQTEKMVLSNGIYNFLLDCLKRNGRILRSIVNVWSNTYQSDFEEFSIDDLKKLYDKSEYGAVVLKCDYEEVSGGCAPQYYKQIKQICEVIKAHKMNVLTILCFEKSAAKQQKAFFDNLESMTFIDIKETAMFKSDAKRFLPLIAKDDEFNIVDKVCATLEDGKGYSRVELAQMYADLHVAHQKTVEFPEYAEFAAVEKRAEKKVEGVAYPTLQNMIGLTSVKEQIDNIISFAKVQKLALSMGLKSPAVTKHMVFTGSPGTAKTTVARLFAQIMKDNDLLTSGVFIEAGRADLIAEYVGHTAPKVRDCFKRARGGVLFIDEAYSLVDDRKGLFGDEAIATIVQEMENNRDSIIVIFAGYREETLGFVNRNSGLKSRIAHYVDFPDYNEGELVAILTHMAKEQGLTIDGGTDALLGIMKTAVGKSNFGNGRFSRNLLDKARLKQAGRVAKMDNPQAEDICTLQAADFELPQEYCNQKAKVMGFGE